MNDWLRLFLETTDSEVLNAWWTTVTVLVFAASFFLSHVNLFFYISKIRQLSSSSGDQSEASYEGIGLQDEGPSQPVGERFQRTIKQLIARVRSLANSPLMHELRLDEMLQVEVRLWRDCKVDLLGQSRSTYDPALAFEWQELGAKQYNRYAVLLWPAVLTGLGILGTFVGLTQGISSLNTGSATLVSDVKGLLGGMDLAFLSSIWGIAFSLIWSFGHRLTYWFAKLHTDRTCRALRQQFPSWTVDQLNATLMREQAQQTASLKSLGTDFAFKIAEVLNALLDQNVAAPMRELNLRMSQYTEQVTEMQRQGYKEIASEVRDAVAGVAGQEIEALADTIRELNYLHRQSHDSYRDMMVTLEKQISMYSELVERFSSVSQDLAGYADVLKGTEERSREQLEQNREAIGQMSGALEKIRLLNQGVQQGQQAITDQLGQLRQTWESSKGEMSGLAATVERAAGNFGEDFVATLQSVHTQIEKLLAETLSQFSGTLAGVRDLMETDVVSLLDGLKQTLTEIDVTLKSSIPATMSNFDASVQRIDKSLSALEPALQRLNDGNQNGRGGR